MWASLLRASLLALPCGLAPERADCVVWAAVPPRGDPGGRPHAARQGVLSETDALRRERAAYEEAARAAAAEARRAEIHGHRLNAAAAAIQNAWKVHRKRCAAEAKAAKGGKGGKGRGSSAAAASKGVAGKKAK